MQFQYFTDQKKIPVTTLLLLFPASVLECTNTNPIPQYSTKTYWCRPSLEYMLYHTSYPVLKKIPQHLHAVSASVPVFYGPEEDSGHDVVVVVSGIRAGMQ